MRLLFLSPHYGTLGGVRLIVDALARAAREDHHEVAAIVDGDAERFPGQAWTVRLYPFPSRARDIRRLERFARKFPPAAARLVSAARRFAPDVVSVHCVRRYAPYAALLRRTAGAAQVLSLQEGALPPGEPENPGLFRLLVRSSAAVAACSEEAAAYARRVGGARDVQVVPNGYDPDQIRTSVPYAHPRPYVLGVGRLERQKGFDLLVEALPLLARAAVDVLIAGDGAERAALAELARERGVGDRLHLLGGTDRATTASLLAGASVVACPSRFEGLPLVCIEALAAERPVVASAVNGIPELIRHDETGLLVSPEDPRALAAAIDRLLSAPAEAATLAARGRAIVEREHRWPVVAARYLALCARVAHESHGRAAA